MKPTKDTPSLDKAALRALRVQLRRLHKLYSWREMARDIYGGDVSHSVLQRLATDGNYTPADEKILTALDLIKKPNPYRALPRWYKRTPEALEYFNGKREQIKSMSDDAKAQRRIVYNLHKH
jgi:hypothetical protein